MTIIRIAFATDTSADIPDWYAFRDGGADVSVPDIQGTGIDVRRIAEGGASRGGAVNRASEGAGRWPEAVFEYRHASLGSPNSFEFSNLPPGGSFILEAASHWNAGDAEFEYTVPQADTPTATYVSPNSTVPTVPTVFTGTVPGNGIVTISVDNIVGGTTAQLSGLLLEFDTGAAPPVGLAVPLTPDPAKHLASEYDGTGTIAGGLYASQLVAPVPGQQIEADRFPIGNATPELIELTTDGQMRIQGVQSGDLVNGQSRSFVDGSGWSNLATYQIDEAS